LLKDKIGRPGGKVIIMYATISKNRIETSVAGFYTNDWYNRDRFLESEEHFEIAYGSLEIDVHRNGKKYLTGFIIDPRDFIVDYLWNRYRKRLPVPRGIEAVSVDTNDRGEILCVDFLKARSFGVDEMEKDLIFPQFCRRRGAYVIQGFEALSLFPVFRYLVRRFKYKETTLVRQGETVYDLDGRRRSKIRLGTALGRTKSIGWKSNKNNKSWA
jgi:hypothetical protein